MDVADDVTEFNYYLQLDPMIAESGQMFGLESFGQSGERKSSRLLLGRPASWPQDGGLRG